MEGSIGGTTRLTLLCHGSIDATRRAAFPADEPLDERGLAEARAAAQRLGRFDRAWSSPARRALETADALGIATRVDAALADCDHGAWTGRTLADLGAERPDDVARWLSDPAAAPHGGESLLALSERVGRWLEDRLEEGGSIVAITHPAVIRAAVTRAIGAPPSAFWRIDVAPLARALLVGHEGRWNLRALG